MKEKQRSKRNEITPPLIVGMILFLKGCHNPTCPSLLIRVWWRIWKRKTKDSIMPPQRMLQCANTRVQCICICSTAIRVQQERRGRWATGNNRACNLRGHPKGRPCEETVSAYVHEVHARKTAKTENYKKASISHRNEAVAAKSHSFQKV